MKTTISINLIKNIVSEINSLNVMFGCSEEILKLENQKLGPIEAVVGETEVTVSISDDFILDVVRAYVRPLVMIIPAIKAGIEMYGNSFTAIEKKYFPQPEKEEEEAAE